MLEYKCELTGADFVSSSRFFPSSKLCSNSHGYKADLKLADQVYKCAFCGLVLDRDINACRILCGYYSVLSQVYPEEMIQHQFKIITESLPETLNACGELLRSIPVPGDGHGSMKQDWNGKVGHRKLSNFL